MNDLRSLMQRFFLLAVLAAVTAARVASAEEPPPTSSRMKEVLKAIAAEEAKKKPAPPSKVVPASTAPEKNVAPAPAKEAPPPAPAKPAGKEAESKEAPTVLPQVEVRKGRITELDIQLHEQAKEIKREKKNTKPTEMDEALNHPTVSKILSIFGGESSRHRAGVAKERVELMEAESDLMEAIAHAPTKEEKAVLEAQLEQLKAYRRELEKSLR